MTAEQWREVKEILHASLQLETSERAAYLDRACAGRAALRQEVESLLASHDDAGDFIERPALAENFAGRRLGPYEILEEIGSGGMGRIYRAERADEFRQQVAIKIVKRGMDTDFILHRFRNERQILAGLDHPNIARLLDGGVTPDGIPYFVMEYIQGRPIDSYCESLKLSIRDRLELFRQVCSAVHYAHQRLVVHRDIKPGNILVTNEGVPKLLDFGIAKIVTDEGVQATLTAAQLMTPDYASPEQIRGDPITTATDVYSLGVLLYQLLTNHQPYHTTSRAMHEIAQVVCESDPVPPSTQARENQHAIEGDLDNIVMKSMRKEPERRYPSVEQFSEDIRRHLEGLPVSARKDTFRYRASKFVRRNKAAVAAGVLVLLSLAGGLAATAWQASVARGERARAERRFNDVRKLANAVLFELHDAIQELPGSTQARLLIVKRAMEYLDSLARESSGDHSLQRELAAAYSRIGDVQGFSGQANLGDVAGSRASYRKAIGILEALTASDPENSEDHLRLAYNYNRLGGTDNTRKALAIAQELVSRNPNNREARLALGDCYDSMGNTLRQTADWKGTLEWRHKQFDLYRTLYEEQPEGERARRNFALAAKKLGAAQIKTGAAVEAMKNYQLAVSLEERIVAADPNNATTRMGLSFSYSDTGFVLLDLKRAPEAVEYYRKALAIREQLYAADPKNDRAKSALASVYWRMGGALSRTGRKQEALEYTKKSVTTLMPPGADLPDEPNDREDIAETYLRLSEAYSGVGNSTEARAWAQRARDILLDLKRQNKLTGMAAEFLPRIEAQINAGSK